MTTFISIFRRSYSVTKSVIAKSCRKQKSNTNKCNNLFSMKDRVSTISTHLDSPRNMDSMNDSVIICDTFTPGTNGINKRKYPKDGIVECKRTVEGLRRKLSNIQVRSPLRTVYESPLDHRLRNKCNGNSSVVTNIAAKRYRNDRDNDIQPPKKKQKIKNLNETIVIVSDDEPGPSTPSQASDITLVGDSNKRVSKTVPKKSPKIKRKKRRSLRLQKLKKANNANKTEPDIDDEEIAVIWSSTSGAANDGFNEKIDPPNSKDMFFVDTAGDESNHQKEYLQNTVMCPPKPSVCQSQKPSSNKTNNKGKKKVNGKLREIIVDGCNVAMGHSHSTTFSGMGLKLVYNYFREKGHVVKIFLPQHQRKKGREYLETWYRRGDVVFTPSRNIAGKNIVSYDDRFIVEYATKCKGIVVSSDQYRDLWTEKPEWRETIERRLIAPTFVGDYVMFPQDPLGRLGPKLDAFLRY